jgi:two-component system KDP operon response regulator KdpE
VLVADSDAQIRRYLRAALTANDFDVIEADNGQDALDQAVAAKADVVILELNLPIIGGIDVITQIRQRSEVPIIVVTASAREADKVAALDSGADDYLSKPFGMAELLARLRAALRHRLRHFGYQPVFRAGRLSVDLVRRHVVCEGRDIKLTPREFAVLRVLVENAGRVVPHEKLLRDVWGEPHIDNAEYLRLYIKQLRQKIEANPERPHYIITEPRVGYRIRDPGTADCTGTS